MLRHVLDVLDLLDDPTVDGERVARYLAAIDPDGPATIEVTRAQGPKGHTDFITVRIPGSGGRAAGGSARTLGIVGRLGDRCAAGAHRLRLRWRRRVCRPGGRLETDRHASAR